MKRVLLKLYSRTVGRILKRISNDLLYATNLRLQILIEIHLQNLKSQIRAAMPENVALDGYRIYSQNDEDGIIAAIFRKIPLPLERGSFIEIGCGDGLQNNTHALAIAGWVGAWVDGGSDNISYIKNHIGESKDLVVEQCFVTRENASELINRLLRALNVDVLDFLSLDIDGNDYYVMDAILSSIKPRVVCVEYNAQFPYPLQVVMPYDKNHVWQRDDYYGASLASMVELFDRHGYTLICCNLSGVNAFFVIDNESDKFQIYPPSVLYRPALMAHQPSLKFLASLSSSRRIS
jgi:hypothetical protein